MISQVTPIGEINYGLILVHGGEHHTPSKQALKIYRRYDYSYLYELEIVDERIKQWLTYNSNGIVVTEVPTLILIVQGQSPLQFPIGYFDLLTNHLSKL